MKTWIVIYNEKGEVKSQIIMAKTFDDAVYEVWDLLQRTDVKGLFEVSR
jgi:hypothetical protein